MSIKTRLVAVTVAAGLALSGALAFGAETASATSPAPALVSHVPGFSGVGTPTVNGLRLRSGPGTRYAAYGLLFRGDRMTITQVVQAGSLGTWWFHVRLTKRSATGLRSGHTGWVYAPYLRKA